MASALNEESVEKKLQNVTNTQDSIQTLSLWLIHHKAHHKKIVRLWYNVLRKAKMSQRLTLFYLCNDVVQHSRKKATVYLESFKGILKLAVAYVRDHSIRQSVMRILTIWQERNVFKPPYIQELKAALSSDKEGSKDKPVIEKSAVEKPTKEKPTKEKPVKASVSKAAAEPAKPKVEVDQKLLAEYKPQKLFDKLISFKRFEADVDSRSKQLSHLRLDASNIEAVKQLKDRAHGNEFRKQFEDSCVKLEDFVGSFEKKVTDRNALVSSLEEGEMFYQAQYGEAKIVANAYKIFGTKLNNLKKKLDELKKTLPDPPSPVPSLTEDAPSPGSTPPLQPDAEPVDMELSDDEQTHHTLSGAAGRKRAESTRTTKSIPQPIPSVTTIRMKIKDKMDNHKSDSDTSPLGKRLASFPFTEKSNKVSKIEKTVNEPSDNLEARIANMLPNIPHASEKSSKGSGSEESSHWNGSKHTPSKSNSRSMAVASSLPDRFQQVSVLDGFEDGGGTPLKDEGSSTPVQDETPEASDPSPSIPQPSNPIDFLTNLISQTKKTNPHSSHFLQNLGFLATTMKSKTDKQPAQELDGSESDKPEPPQSWSAWKAKQTQEKSPLNGQDVQSVFPIQPPGPVPPVQPVAVPPVGIVGAYGTSTLPIPEAQITPPVRQQRTPPSTNIPTLPDVSIPPPWLPMSQPPPPPHIGLQPTSPAIIPHKPNLGGVPGIPPPGQVPAFLPQSSIEEAAPGINSFIEPTVMDLRSPPPAIQQSPLVAPKGILRNRNNSLKEVQLVPYTEADDPQPISSIPTIGAARSRSSSGSSQPTSPITGPKPPPHPPGNMHTPGRRTSLSEDQREFIEKLKRKTSGAGDADTSQPAPKPQVFLRNPVRPNLTTIVLTGGSEEKHVDSSGDKKSVPEKPVGAPISTIDRVDRVQPVPRHVDHSDRGLDRGPGYEDFNAPRGYNYRDRRHPYGEHRDDYLDHRLPVPPRDAFRDPYYLSREPYGHPPPPKRPYPDPYYDHGRSYYPPRY